MNEKILALFENSNFFKDGISNIKEIRAASPDEIFEFCDQLSDITSVGNFEIDTSLYSHSASLALSGAKDPCKNLDCRLQKVKELSHFATLYSDRVFINNFTYENLLHSDINNEDHDELRFNFICDLKIYEYLFPLLEKNIVVPVTHPDICPHCLTIQSIGETNEDKYKKIYNYLLDKYYNEVKFSLEYYDGEYALLAKGPEDLLRHGNAYMIYKNKDKIKNLTSSIIDKLHSSGEVILKKKEAKLISAGEDIADGLMRTVSFEVGGAKSLRTYYLSERELEIQILKQITDDPATKKCSNLMGNYLNCLLPFIDDIPPIDLLKLRKNEEDSFILFRSALSKAIEEYKENGHSFTERDAQMVYADIIQPELAKLESKVKRAKRHFHNDSRRKIIGWAGALSVGFYAGLFTSNPITGSIAFGVTKAASELLENLMANSDAEESIKDDELYFLWKVKQLVQ